MMRRAAPSVDWRCALTRKSHFDVIPSAAGDLLSGLRAAKADCALRR